jgi:heat shock protein HtpX
MLLVANESGQVAQWFDSHPPISRRIRRIYGRDMGPLPLAREEAPATVAV